MNDNDLFALRNLVLLVDTINMSDGVDCSKFFGFDKGNPPPTSPLCDLIKNKLENCGAFVIYGMISPNEDDFHETLNTLEFCLKAREVF
jgi:hypothetical protein